MRRRILTLLSSLSLLIWVASAVQWITCRPGGSTWHFTFDTGTPATQRNLDLTLIRQIRFEMQRNNWNRWNMVHLTFPAALPIVVFSVLPVVWLLRSKPKVPAGVCRVCGYDLRASPQRCPECGTAHRDQQKIKLPEIRS